MQYVRLYDDHSLNGTLSVDGPGTTAVYCSDLLFVPMSTSKVSRAHIRCEEDELGRKYYYECEDQRSSGRCRLLTATSKMGVYEIYTTIGCEQSTVGFLKQDILCNSFSLYQHNTRTLRIEYKCQAWKSHRPRMFSVVRVSHSHPQKSDFHASGPDTLPMFVNRTPVYYAPTGSYMLNFGGRVSSPSPINFLLVCPSEPNYTTITFGKHSHNLYVLDHTYPWSAYEAFGIGLAALIH